jgi:hypothetical protein
MLHAAFQFLLQNPLISNAGVSKPTTAVAAAQSVCSLSVLFQIQVSQKRFQTNRDSAKKVYRPPGVVGG